MPKCRVPEPAHFHHVSVPMLIRCRCCLYRLLRFRFSPTNFRKHNNLSLIGEDNSLKASSAEACGELGFLGFSAVAFSHVSCSQGKCDRPCSRFDLWLSDTRHERPSKSISLDESGPIPRPPRIFSDLLCQKKYFFGRRSLRRQSARHRQRRHRDHR